jgi:hypothetical protein
MQPFGVFMDIAARAIVGNAFFLLIFRDFQVICRSGPELAYMEGSMLGPSSSDCLKSYQRTGIPSADMLRKGAMTPGAPGTDSAGDGLGSWRRRRQRPM